MIRIAWQSAVAALVGAAVFAQAAASKPPPDPVPDVPGIGDPRGIIGAPPEVAISGGREYVNRRRVAWIEVECTTSTKAGCSGVLKLEDLSGRTRGSAKRELPEADAASFRVALPRKIVKRARRSAGTRVVAVAEATDSLGRTGEDSAVITLIAPR